MSTLVGTDTLQVYIDMAGLLLTASNPCTDTLQVYIDMSTVVGTDGLLLTASNPLRICLVKVMSTVVGTDTLQVYIDMAWSTIDALSR